MLSQWRFPALHPLGVSGFSYCIVWYKDGEDDIELVGYISLQPALELSRLLSRHRTLKSP